MLAAMIAQLGWEAMTAAERYAAIGGTAGLVSVVVSLYIAWENRRSLRKQLLISAEANTTAKLAVENQTVANEVTKRSVDDQLAMSQLARSASARIAEAGMCDVETATKNGDLAAIDWIATDADFRVLTLTLINEGMGPAYKLKLTPVSVDGHKLTYHHNAGWRLLKGGNDLWGALQPFASTPVGTFLSLPPGHTLEFRVAVRYESFRMAAKGPYFEAMYRLEFEDGHGAHTRCFAFGVLGVGVGFRAKGSVRTMADEECQPE